MEGWGLHAVSGLDIGCGWFGECVTFTKILINNKNIRMILYSLNLQIIDIYMTFNYISDDITMHCSDNPHLNFIGTINRQRVADWFTSTFYKIFSNLYPNINLEFRQFAKHNITINK